MAGNPKTYVVERISIDYYEVETALGEHEAVTQVLKPWYERTVDPVRTTTEYHVSLKLDPEVCPCKACDHGT